jgi:histidinol phosphatase-like PHP family hydrolase
MGVVLYNQRMKHFLFVLGLAACAPKVGPVTTTKPPMTFLKGQTHAHSNNSGDSQTPPADVAAWYSSRGYDFIVFTDHNFVTVLPGGATELAAEQNAASPVVSTGSDAQQPKPPHRQPGSSMLTIPGVELTQNSRDCTPPPEPGLGCLLHMNALFVEAPIPAEIPWGSGDSKERVDIYQRAVDASKNLKAIAQLNHPNFHYGADAKLIAEMGKRGVVLIELFNQSIDINNEGDAKHPSTEALWDQVLTMGVKVFAVASDDAHHYNDVEQLKARGEEFYEGDLGFIMVRSSKDPKEIKAAVARGDFYSSNGVLLSRYESNKEEIEVIVDAKPGRKYTIHFIGEGGKKIASQEGNSARLALAKVKGNYVRVRVDDDAGKHAWLQPVWLN